MSTLKPKPQSEPTNASESPSDAIEQRIAGSFWRLRLVGIFLGLLGALLILRLFDMQVLTWQDYQPAVVRASTLETVDDNTPWGVVVDRDGVLLAADRFTYRITATPHLIDPADWREIGLVLESILGISSHSIEQLLSDNAEQSYLVLDPAVTFEMGEALVLERQRRLAEGDYLLEHIHPYSRPRRFYPQGSLASQLLGFLNAERRPVLGLERYYRSFLPANGVGLPKGRWQRRSNLDEEVLRLLPSGTNKGLVLSIDRTIQWIIEDELREGVDFYRAESGTIIVMEPRTGAILGMANYPTFDGNRYELEEPETFTNRAVSAQYEPGSIFKVITVAGALDSGTVEAGTVFTDTGTVVIGQRTIQNSTRTALGRLSVADALAQSNNVVTVQIAQALGRTDFYAYVDRFGFGTDTHIDLSGEVPGLVKAPGDLTWSLSDLGTNSFGQGLAVTPIQMISAVSAIANDGKLMRPYIVEARIDGEDVLLTEPTVGQQAISMDTASLMRELMVHVVDTGNKQAQVPGYAVAGKSGTAEIATAEGYTSDRTIASFVGFAPADDPQFVILVKLDKPDPDISRWASQTAAPIFKRVAVRLFDHLDIPPDSVRLATER